SRPRTVSDACFIEATMIGPESISVPSRSKRTTDLRIAAILATSWGNPWFPHGAAPSGLDTRAVLDLPAGGAGSGLDAMRTGHRTCPSGTSRVTHRFHGALAPS